MNIHDLLTPREVVLLRVALINRMGRLKQRMLDPEVAKSYHETWELTNKLHELRQAAAGQDVARCEGCTPQVVDLTDLEQRALLNDTPRDPSLTTGRNPDGWNEPGMGLIDWGTPYNPSAEMSHLHAQAWAEQVRNATREAMRPAVAAKIEEVRERLSLRQVTEAVEFHEGLAEVLRNGRAS